jgi:hypothetical protein
MRNWPYAGKMIISKVVLVQEHRLCEGGFKIGICRMNDQEERELKHKFVCLFPKR